MSCPTRGPNVASAHMITAMSQRSSHDLFFLYQGLDMYWYLTDICWRQQTWLQAMACRNDMHILVWERHKTGRGDNLQGPGAVQMQPSGHTALRSNCEHAFGHAYICMHLKVLQTIFIWNIYWPNPQGGHKNLHLEISNTTPVSISQH